ncbi:uncharacterized protein FIBRA_04226 [Fibroporia radiculosa]|uniref:Uncharacterized protein n=1 Tax=Fibroporia radiculosa TaxID=599839 RepID=J4G715_9APHY|nr:uncharacterized protein FIBRA_04226 [Fibroporia radiculosa]CCM02148.1 predicted protein [Fibroporia radiculosa]
MPTQDPAYSPEESEEENDDRASRTSGSTYYVLPTPGQKVKLIVGALLSIRHVIPTLCSTITTCFQPPISFHVSPTFSLTQCFSRTQVPNAASLYTATSTTKSAHSPQSAHPGYKKPFFQRIFHMPKLAGSMSSSDSRGHGGAGKNGCPPSPLKRKHIFGARRLGLTYPGGHRRAREREL